MESSILCRRSVPNKAIISAKTSDHATLSDAVNESPTCLMTWLIEEKPDVALLQEIKSVGENFTSDLFENLGYNVEASGQKSFNGVSILPKFPLEDVVC